EQGFTVRDVEDPAYDPDSGTLYVLGLITHPDGDDGTEGPTEPVIFRITADNETFTEGLNVDFFSIDHLHPTDQFEGMALDPNSGNLLVAAKESRQIYEINPSDPLNVIRTIDASGVPDLYEIGGLGAVDVNGQTHYWVTDRGSDCDHDDDGFIAELTLGEVTNHQPRLEITALTPTEVSVGETVRFVAEAFDDDGDALEFSLVEPPTGTVVTEIDPTQIEVSWKASGAPRVVRFLVRVEDGGTPASFAVGLVTVTVKSAGGSTTPPPGGGGGGGSNPPGGGGGGGSNPPGGGGGSKPPAQPGKPGGGGGSQQPPAKPPTKPPADPGGSTGASFIDDNGHVFEADIEWLANSGITKGCNPPKNDRFCPDDGVARCREGAFLVGGLGYTDDSGGENFADDNG